MDPQVALAAWLKANPFSRTAWSTSDRSPRRSLRRDTKWRVKRWTSRLSVTNAPPKKTCLLCIWWTRHITLSLNVCICACRSHMTHMWKKKRTMVWEQLAWNQVEPCTNIMPSCLACMLQCMAIKSQSCCHYILSFACCSLPALLQRKDSKFATVKQRGSWTHLPLKKSYCMVGVSGFPHVFHIPSKPSRRVTPFEIQEPCHEMSSTLKVFHMFHDFWICQELISSIVGALQGAMLSIISIFFEQTYPIGSSPQLWMKLTIFLKSPWNW